MKTLRVALMVAMVSLAGCATFQNIFGSSIAQATLQLAIDTGVGLVLANNPGDALAIKDAALALATLSAGASTTVASFEADADAKINAMAGINAVEKLALQQIVSIAGSALVSGGAALPPTAKADLAVVFQDVANATGAYAMQLPKARAMNLVSPFR